MTEFLALKMHLFTLIHLSASISVPMDMAVETKALFIGALFMVVSIFFSNLIQSVSRCLEVDLQVKLLISQSKFSGPRKFTLR